jgi:dipeptidyl aminopeptidase/acylaminoacyl peptidase
MISRTSWLCLLVTVMACGGGGSKDPVAPTPGADPGAPPPGAEPGAPAPAPAVGHPSNDLIDRRVLFGNPEKANVQISPDGKHVSWLAAKDGVMNAFVAPYGKPAEARSVTADSARPVRLYFWANDSKHLLYLQDVGGDEDFHLHRVTIATGEAVDLTPIPKVNVNLVNTSIKRPGHILIGLNDRDPKYHDLWEIEVATGKRTLVAKNELGFGGWIADEELKPRLAQKLEHDGTTITFLADGKGGWAELFRAAPRDSVDILGLTKRGDAAYISDDRDRNTAGLFLMDLKTQKKKLILEDARADITNVIAHPTELTPLASNVDYDKRRIVVIDKSVQADFDGLAKLADGGVITVPSMTHDNKRWLVAIHGDRQPTRFFTWDRTKKKGELLFSSRPDLEGKPLARMHPVIVEARDGMKLVSYLTLPAAADADADGKADKPVPAVLVVHGGPWARDVWGFSSTHQLLANRGYAVLSVNFRGSTGLGKDYLNAGNGEWGKKMHDDLIDAKRWMVAQGVTAENTICIMGGSYGGYATLAGLTLTPDEFACGVDIVGPSNILTLVNTIPPYWAAIVGVFKFRMGDWTNPEVAKQLLEVSPLTHVAKIKKPLLIGQGANDPRVKQSESDQIVKAMQDKGLPVTYILFPDEGHGFARPENNLSFYAAAEAFLSAHLGGKYQPISKEDLAGSSLQMKAGAAGIPGWPR